MDSSKSKKAISVLLVTSIVLSAFGIGLVSAVVDWVTITAVEDEGAIAWTGNETYLEVSHRKDSITFTVHTTPSGECVELNVTPTVPSTNITNATGYATFKWTIPDGIALGNHTIMGRNCTIETDNRTCIVNITNTAPVITAILVKNTTGWHNLSAGENVTATAGDTIEVSVNVTDGDGYEDITEVKVNMRAFNPELDEWVSLEKKLNDTTWAVYNGSVEVRKFVGSTGRSITANATDSRSASVKSTSAGNLIVNPASASKWAIFGPDSVTDVNDITQFVAVQDEYGNNLTTANAAQFPFTATMTVGGSAEVTSTNPLTITVANTTAEGVFNSAFEIHDGKDETVTIEVWGNELEPASKDITFYGAVHHIAVSVDKEELYANNTDTLTLTAQLQDKNNNNLAVSGVNITLTANNTLLIVTPPVTRPTDKNGTATFVVRASTKSGYSKLLASTAEGKSGTSDPIKLKQAPGIGNCAVAYTTPITAGVESAITATLRDYAGDAIKSSAEFPVTFNITSGDGYFTENSATLITVPSTDSKGNATVHIYSENASTTLTVNVTVRDETGVEKRIQEFNIDVNPNVIDHFEISPSPSVGLPARIGASKEFAIQLKDAYTNNNETANVEILITTDNPALGNMNNGTNNYSESIIVRTNDTGMATFKYFVNTTEEDTAHLTLNATAYNITDMITITTSGPKGLELTFNKTAPVVNETIEAIAQLTDGNGKPLGIRGITIDFTLKKDAKIIKTDSDDTDEEGKARFAFNVSEAGVYEVTASNATYGLIDTNTTTFSGTMVSLVVTANGTRYDYSTVVNSTVKIEATAYDEHGNVAVGAVGTVDFYADAFKIGSDDFTNGVASVDYTGTEVKTVRIVAFCTAELQDMVNVTFGPPVVECPWDLSGPAGVPDGNINIFDIVAVADHWGETGAAGWIAEDLSGAAGVPDGTINIWDIVAVADHWGVCP